MRLSCLFRAVAIVCIILSPVKADDGQTLFRSQVRELLTNSCIGCHNSQTKKGGLDLSRRETALKGGDSGEAISPGSPELSLLVEKVVSGEMPPKGDKLSGEQVETLKKWIAANADYDGEPLAPKRAGLDWWSLRPIAQPQIPSVKSPNWVRNPIDTFVLARLEASGLSPSPEADRRTLIRRLTFDLVGLPPTPQEIQDFLGDTRPDAYEHLVDRLLASPRYGERWARHWLDVVRFGESHGYETNNLRPTAWPYRDWVIRAFNDDLPFARFVAEQFAGDVLPDGDWLTKSATGFLVGGTHDVVGNQTPEGMKQQRVDDLDDMITATGSSFLGLTVHCSRCHDHKFDPIKQADYYGLQAIFGGVEHAERGVPAPDFEKRKRDRTSIEIELAKLDADIEASSPLTGPGTKKIRREPVDSVRNVERFLPTPAKFIRFTVKATADGTQPCIDEFEIFSTGNPPKNLALASTGAKAKASSLYPNDPHHAIEHINDGQYGNSQSWISNEPELGWIEIELPEVAEIGRITWARDRVGDYRDRLATSYTIEVANEPGEWRLVADSTDRDTRKTTIDPVAQSLGQRRTELRAKLAALGDTMSVYAGTFKPPGPTRILKRGDPMQPGDEVSPSGLGAVKPILSLSKDASESERRMALARWIASPENPLPSRVVVNRLWHHHFGRGIVSTPGDFGYNGDRPSHPELLDWLARQFLENGGRMKPIHRLSVTSASYRQTSDLNETAAKLDRDNRLIWRMAPKRLEAEAIRDAMLAASGTLDLRMGGPGYSIWEDNSNYVVVFKPKADLGPDTYRRMIYQFKPRSQPDPTFGAFDCPDSALVAPRRNTSTTALQALNLLNSRFILTQSKAMAERLKREAGDESSAQAALAFRLVFGREANEPELKAASEIVTKYGATTLIRALFNANEFVYLR